MVSIRHRARLLLSAFVVTIFISSSGGACFGATLFERSLSLFQARAQQSSPQEYTFVVLGDSREGEKTFRRALQLAASYQPLFILHGGDYSDRGGAAETDAFLALLQQTVPQVPLFVVVGNHENRAVFQQKVGPLNFTVQNERLGLTVVGIDNASYGVKPPELAYLRSALEKGQRSSFAAMHIPPKTPRWWRHTFTEGADELKKIVESTKPKGLFFGHVHLFDSAEFGGVPAFITGGAGAPLVSFGFPGEAGNHILVVRVKGGQALFEKVAVR